MIPRQAPAELSSSFSSFFIFSFSLRVFFFFPLRRLPYCCNSDPGSPSKPFSAPSLLRYAPLLFSSRAYSSSLPSLVNSRRTVLLLSRLFSLKGKKSTYLQGSPRKNYPTRHTPNCFLGITNIYRRGGGVNILRYGPSGVQGGLFSILNPI